jgi:serine O-acetyltransferase
MKQVIKYIQSDLWRYAGNSSFRAFIREYVLNRAYRVQVWFRLSKLAGPFGKFAKFVSYFKQTKSGVQLGLGTDIGYGLYIGHGGPIVINPHTVIGNNVNLSQFTTIGSNSDQFAVIEDEVYIGPNVAVVEGVRIGKQATIGAGSVVTKHIPTGATAAGNYAKVLNNANPGRYINNKWTDFN